MLETAPCLLCRFPAVVLGSNDCASFRQASSNYFIKTNERAEGRFLARRSELLAPASKFECALAEIEQFLVVDLLCFPSSVRIVMKFVAVVQQVS